MGNPTEENAIKNYELRMLKQQTDILNETRKTNAFMVAATFIVAIGTFMQGVDSDRARGIYLILTSFALFFFVMNQWKK